MIRSQAYKRLPPILLITLYLLIYTLPTPAQDNAQPAPQFLYRHENRLILLNGNTGEATELPFEVTDQDHVEWSPDGAYLLLLFHHLPDFGRCLNLYDVDTLTWVYPKPISCGVEDTVFNTDGTRLIYSFTGNHEAALWEHDLAEQTNQMLYEHSLENDYDVVGINDIRWSPSEKYLTFIDYRWIMGGTLNTLVVMEMERNDYFTLSAPDPYYASYNPIWSEDERRFLITLQEQYATSGSIPMTNHQGDVYLVSIETGEAYRLTYTPADYEANVRWTEEGKIAFTIIRQEEMTLTPNEAMNIPTVPFEDMVMPEEIDPNILIDSMRNLTISPDQTLAAWVDFPEAEQANTRYELNIGYPGAKSGRFSVPISEDYQYRNILIGWRPSPRR